jgi:translation initiation factor IF-1
MNQKSPIAEGVVRQQLPSGLYEVEIDGTFDSAQGRPNRVTAHIGGGLDRNFIRLLVGDRVIVELTPRDLTRGRIVRKA